MSYMCYLSGSKSLVDFIENYDRTAETKFDPGIQWFESDQIYSRSGMYAITAITIITVITTILTITL